jgi:hypothetical protein
MTKTFKPTAPPQGRDWLTNGFGICRCMCERCAPRKQEEKAVADDASATAAVAMPAALNQENSSALVLEEVANA